MAKIDPFRSEAEKLVADHEVREVDFSGPTYQVQVCEEYWPFLQFDEEGEVKDAFCSCEAEEACVHLSAALLRIFNGQADPLHIRFGKSLWNALCQIFGRVQGYGADILKKEGPGHYILTGASGKRLFSVEAKCKATKLWLETIVEQRVKENEQNSLKFSGLTHDELSLWREGRPPPFLRYELSFWSDLAKGLMFFQDEGAKYTIAFGYGSNGLPNEISVDFAEISLRFYVSEANLPEVIPALASVLCPLSVHSFQDEAIQEVRYDKKTGALNVVANRKAAPRATPENAIELEEWLFVPKKGFVSKGQHELLTKPVIPENEVSGALEAYSKIIARHLKGDRLHHDAISPRYQVGFDSDWNLHVKTYLFDAGDLARGASRMFNHWAYLDDEGFYRLDAKQFEKTKVVILQEEVSDFVHTHRLWLNTQDGFHTHLTSVESQLTYSVSEEGELSFGGRVEMPEGKDFGEWVFIADQGFYSKARGRRGSPVRSGTTVGPGDVPLFLEVNRDELEMVKGFFAERCPVVGRELKVAVNAREQVDIRPKYDLDSGYTSKNVQFFDDYAYVKGEGFSHISPEARLPERFRAPVTLKGEELRLFLTYELETILPFISSLDRRLQSTEALQLAVRDASKDAIGIKLHLAYVSPLGSVPARKVIEAIEKGQTVLMTEAGLLHLEHSHFQWLKQIPPERIKAQDNVVHLTTLEFLRLIVLEEPTVEKGSAAAELIRRFSSFKPDDAPNLEGLTSTLRPYQAVGVNWLWFLYGTSLSGLLCDDMGLGKTHQAMALIAAMRNVKKENRLCLVVCPTSVIYHWKEKLAQFLPDAKVYTFYGTHRSIKEVEKCDIVLTSYGILRSEKKALSKLGFEVAIYDEIQVAKNASSQTHHALTAMKARMRIGLTGTPIENSLRELKALFDVVLPTYFPSAQQFRDTFITPIERNHDEARKTQLRQVIRPFVMRRKKEEVLTDLPEKTEEKSHCELAPSQRRLYNEVLLKSKEELIHNLQDESKPAPYVHVFALLTALKQICDHPAIHYKEPSNYKNHQSGKWQLFLELLNQARESSQKVVIFSQYLGMLDIIEAHLKEMNIGFAAIRGSTSDREKQLKRFQTDPTCEVFVGSLQAVGLGVELTAASIVIHYDRWWNAARENQATDRVHRIGQTRGVQVFKLLTLGTLEEHIDAMIERKGKLMEEVVGSEQSQVKAFTREELIELLSLASEPE